MDGAKVLRDEMRRKAPRSSKAGGSRGRGHAADHIGAEVVESRRGRVSVNVGPPRWGWYLIFPEFGARAHTIIPDGSAIRVGGDDFAPAVSHPGNPSRPWMRPSFDTRKRNAVETVKSSLARRIRDAAR